MAVKFYSKDDPQEWRAPKLFRAIFVILISKCNMPYKYTKNPFGCCYELGDLPFKTFDKPKGVSF